jgi:Glycerol-3-phosphate acyltransferase
MSASLFLIIAFSYLLGSIPVGYLLVRFFKKQDIRTVGSGNIGATNVLRSGGKGLGAATFVLDVAKGALAVALGGWLAPILVPNWPVRNVEALVAKGRGYGLRRLSCDCSMGGAGCYRAVCSDLCHHPLRIIGVHTWGRELPCLCVVPCG